MRVLIFAALGLSAAYVSAANNSPTVLEPSSQWVVDYADNNCRLVRMFGTDRDAIKLVFEQVAPHSTITAMLVGKFHASTDNNFLAFEPLADVRISGGQSVNAVGTHDSVIYWPRRMGRGRWGLIPEKLIARMRRADPAAAEASPSAPSDLSASRVTWNDHRWNVEQEGQWRAEDADFGVRAGQVTAVVLNPGNSGSVSLHTGEMAKPLQALEQCASDSLKDWGIDPAVQSTVASRSHPVIDPQTLFTSDDYPQAALQSLKEDNLSVWLNIDARGQIASCRVISDFASPDINGAICGMIQRKERFTPARTKAGTSVPDFYIQSFVFRIG